MKLCCLTFFVVFVCAISASAQFVTDSNWVAFGPVTESGGFIKTLVCDSAGNLYIGGGFPTAGGVSCGNVAKWDGTNWYSLDGGADAPVYCLAFDSHGYLYAGGHFSSIGGVPVNCIAIWNGTNWSGLGSGLGSYVNSLAFDASGNLYAGGLFTNSGNVRIYGVAEWNGTNWSAVGTGLSFGVDGGVGSIAFDSGGNLYAGGSFGISGQTNGPCTFAKWDGTNWSPEDPALFTYPDYGVDALANDNSGNLYAASIGFVAELQGTNWAVLGTGVNNTVSCLAFDRFGNVYAGGDFSSTALGPASAIAVWDGSNWLGLGSGLTGGNNALALTFSSAGNLFVGGIFDSAGGQVSYNLAEVLLSPESYGLNVTPLGKGTNIISGSGTPGFTYALDMATNLIPPIQWKPQFTNTQPGANLLFTNVTTSRAGYYRTRFIGHYVLP